MTGQIRSVGLSCWEGSSEGVTGDVVAELPMTGSRSSLRVEFRIPGGRRDPEQN